MPVPQIDVNLWICVVICCIMKEKGERNAGMGDSAYNVLGLPDLELVSQHYETRKHQDGYSYDIIVYAVNIFFKSIKGLIYIRS